MGTIIIPIFQQMKPRYRKVKQLTVGRTANKWQSQDSRLKGSNAKAYALNHFVLLLLIIIITTYWILYYVPYMLYVHYLIYYSQQP